MNDPDDLSSAASDHKRQERTRHDARVKARQKRAREMPLPTGVLPRAPPTQPISVRFDPLRVFCEQFPVAAQDHAEAAQDAERKVAARTKVDTLPLLDRTFQAYLKDLQSPWGALDPLEQMRTPVARPRQECVSAAHESQLLVQAGAFRLQDRSLQLPPCVHGDRCQGRLAAIPGMQFVPGGRGMVLCQRLTDMEWLKLLQDGVLHRVPPRPCVLCYRRAAAQVVVYAEANHAMLSVHVKPEALRYTASVNGPGAYDSRACLLPSQYPHAGVLHFPVVGSTILKLKVVRDARGNWRVDQSALLWRDPFASIPEPRPGETVADFGHGARPPHP